MTGRKEGSAVWARARASDGTDGVARDLDALRVLAQEAFEGCHVSYLNERTRDFSGRDGGMDANSGSSSSKKGNM